ncbi:hypothetical protein F5Y15DRAFT_419988 [Xylariaceae sp. FL0016]|nr:hypothetical protein F5Y15DRAFT_419988 [Xylariaceae sp. FL0016]
MSLLDRSRDPNRNPPKNVYKAYNRGGFWIVYNCFQLLFLERGSRCHTDKYDDGPYDDGMKRKYSLSYTSVSDPSLTNDHFRKSFDAFRRDLPDSGNYTAIFVSLLDELVDDVTEEGQLMRIAKESEKELAKSLARSTAPSTAQSERPHETASIFQATQSETENEFALNAAGNDMRGHKRYTFVKQKICNLYQIHIGDEKGEDMPKYNALVFSDKATLGNGDSSADNPLYVRYFHLFESRYGRAEF